MVDRHIFCSDCGAKGEAGCDCGAGYISASAFAAKAIERNPEKSNRAIAEEIGVSYETVRRERPTDTNVSVEPRTGKDGRRRKMPRKVTRRAEAEEFGEHPPKAERHIDTRTGENISRTEAIKREACSDLQARAIELEGEVRELRYELGQRPSMDDLRRSDAISHHVQRITTDIDTYNLFRRCLHPDSRNSVSDEILHKAWLAFRNLEPLTYDKSKLPPPLPATVDELIRRRMGADEKRKAARKATAAK
jgi:hypothetical protein